MAFFCSWLFSHYLRNNRLHSSAARINNWRANSFRPSYAAFFQFFIVSGYQAVLFAILIKTFAVNEKMVPEDKRLKHLYKILPLEYGLLLSLLSLAVGLILLGFTVKEWYNTDFSNLEYSYTLRLVIPGVMLASLGFESILFSFFASILGVRRR
jgi:hypothetical protein